MSTLRYKVTFGGIDSIAAGAGSAFVQSSFFLGYFGVDNFSNGYEIQRTRNVDAAGKVTLSQRLTTFADGREVASKIKGFGTYSLAFNLDPLRYPTATLSASASCFIYTTVATSAYCSNAAGFQSRGIVASASASRDAFAVVPEPGALALFAGGVTGLRIARRRTR